MTRLLVSVRDEVEAQAALDGGADLIDIKEPSRGALGMADVAVWRRVQAVVGNRAPVSAALGELQDFDAAVLGSDALAGLRYVKVGLHGTAGDLIDWQDRLQILRDQLPRGTTLVGVAYADQQRADAPSPWQVLHAANALQLPVLLIDTFDKTQGPLWTSLADDEVRELVSAAHRAKIQVALAGSLTLATLPRALQLEPDWIAVRGAACEGKREATVVVAAVSALKRAIGELSAKRLETAVGDGTSGRSR